MEISFRDFLLNENKTYLGQRVGDVLNALHDLNQNAKAMGTRQLVKNSESIVNQIRRILHSNWQKKNERFLTPLQKAGVAIMKAVEEKDDLSGILGVSATELEGLLGKMGVPVNQIAAPETTQQQPPQEPAVAPPQGEEPPEQPSPPTQQPPAAEGMPLAPPVAPSAAPMPASGI